MSHDIFVDGSPLCSLGIMSSLCHLLCCLLLSENLFNLLLLSSLEVAQNLVAFLANNVCCLGQELSESLLRRCCHCLTLLLGFRQHCFILLQASLLIVSAHARWLSLDSSDSVLIFIDKSLHLFLRILRLF